MYCEFTLSAYILYNIPVYPHIRQVIASMSVSFFTKLYATLQEVKFSVMQKYFINHY